MHYPLLILIFIRPFISSLAYPWTNSFYSLILTVALLLCLASNSASRNRLKTLFLPISIFVTVLAISSFLSIDSGKSISELYKYLVGILFVLALAGSTEKLKQRYVCVILSGGVIIGILAIYQYFIGFSHLRNFINSHNISSPFVMDYLRQKRVFFPFVTPGILASYLAMTVPLAFLYKKKFWLLAPILCALFLTGSLSALISLFLGALFYLLLKKELKGIKGLFLLGLFLLIPLSFLLRFIAGKEHLSPLFSVFMRVSYWRDSLEIIKLHPFLGIGLGNFNLIYSRYAHNSFLQFWAEAGLVGIASLFWLVYSMLAGGIKRINENKENLVLFTCLVIFVLNNLLDFSFFLPEVSLIWWVILGLFSRPKS